LHTQICRLSGARLMLAVRRHEAMASHDESTEGAARLEAGMPLLPLAGTLRSKRWLGHFLGVSAPREPKGKRIVDGLVRLSDKAICEYQDCRESMLLFLREGNPDNFHRAQDHLESCIQALHRGINFLERLRGLGYVQSDLSPLVAKPRDLEVLRDAVRTRIRTFRDFMEHMEEDIIA
jgi:hypothetical protein